MNTSKRGKPGRWSSQNVARCLCWHWLLWWNQDKPLTPPVKGGIWPLSDLCLHQMSLSTCCMFRTRPHISWKKPDPQTSKIRWTCLTELFRLIEKPNIRSKKHEAMSCNCFDFIFAFEITLHVIIKQLLPCLWPISLIRHLKKTAQQCLSDGWLLAWFKVLC